MSERTYTCPECGAYPCEGIVHLNGEPGLRFMPPGTPPAGASEELRERACVVLSCVLSALDALLVDALGMDDRYRDELSTEVRNLRAAMEQAGATPSEDTDTRGERMSELLRRVWLRVTGQVRWRVLYHDGKRSYTYASWSEAARYAEIFGGVVQAVYPRQEQSND